MKCHRDRSGFHFLKTLNICHWPGQDGHREAHLLSCWPETSNPTSPGWPRTHLWKRFLPRPARLAQLSRADLNKIPQIEIEAPAKGQRQSLCMDTLPLLTGIHFQPQSQCFNSFFLHLWSLSFSHLLPVPNLSFCLQILKHYYVLDPGEAAVH